MVVSATAMRSIPLVDSPDIGRNLGHDDRKEYLSLRSWRSSSEGTVPLFLAPMERLADAPFRTSFAECIGGFDEACMEFIRVSYSAEWAQNVVRGLSRRYNSDELGNVPLAVQIMGSNPDMLQRFTFELCSKRRPPRVDLNCGCPANTVTGNGAGSSLLKTPDLLHEIVAAMVEGSRMSGQNTPISVKMRSGFNDTKLFKDNLLAAQDAGASFVTIHPRTKKQSYSGNADWSLIGLAKDILSIPVVGNGDVKSVKHALNLLRETGCDGVMIGRGAVEDPFIFKKIKAASKGEEYLSENEVEDLNRFLELLVVGGKKEVDVSQLERDQRRGMARRLKHVTRYLFQRNDYLQNAITGIVRMSDDDISPMLSEVKEKINQHWDMMDA